MAEEGVAIRVQPRASRAGVAGERAGAIVVRVNAPPAEGKANEAVRKLVARAAGVPKGDVEIVRGERSRDKVVRARGLSARELRERLLAAG
ncbi:MAG TPA: DUF167 domain-containing protein [Solirubrobacterales bacterium]